MPPPTCIPYVYCFACRSVPSCPLLFYHNCFVLLCLIIDVDADIWPQLLQSCSDLAPQERAIAVAAAAFASFAAGNRDSWYGRSFTESAADLAECAPQVLADLLLLDDASSFDAVRRSVAPPCAPASSRGGRWCSG